MLNKSSFVEISKNNKPVVLFDSGNIASKTIAKMQNNNNIAQSISRKGNCWDNVVIECFFRSLKTERLNYQSFANHYEVVQNVESYIYFYNYKRIHSAIGYITPAQKMAELEKVA